MHVAFPPDLETSQGKCAFRLSSCGRPCPLALRSEPSALPEVCSRRLGVAQGSLFLGGAPYLGKSIFPTEEVFRDLAVVHVRRPLGASVLVTSQASPALLPVQSHKLLP